MSTAVAQTVYVTDILQLGLHNAQDTSDAPFANLVSGTELEILQRVPNFAEVRTPDGRQGWVKSAFLVEEKPAQLIVSEAMQELDDIKQALDNAVADRERAEQDAERIVVDSMAQIEAARSSADELGRLRSENDDYMQQLETFRGSLPIRWVIGAVVLATVLGFLLGLWSLDTYIRRRHGGFRLY